MSAERVETPETSGPKVLGHDYDGIQEYDNPQPGWWSALFVVTILWAGAYWAYYEIGAGQSVEQEFRAETAWRLEQRANQPGLEVNEEMILALREDKASQAWARERFLSVCAACHRPDGGGSVGPNLTDDRWLHGGTPLQIYNTIHEGVPEKGMLRWADSLKDLEIAKLAAFVTTLQGTNPPNPKPPEGNPVGTQ